MDVEFWLIYRHFNPESNPQIQINELENKVKGGRGQKKKKENQKMQKVEK